jgi:hypothetical protein
MKIRFAYDSGTWTDSVSDPVSCDNTVNGECLQEALTQLMSNNQSLRFELFGAQQKLMRIECLLFGRESHLLQQLIPADLLMELHGLCKSSEDRTCTFAVMGSA